tara:strand:- start:270 stop:653 length:384 start_codon:yes stop_codon:yes gene_type:complete
MNTTVETVSVRTTALRGKALDWACAKITNPEWFEDGLMDGDPLYMLDMDDGDCYEPSENAQQCKSIIEEHIARIERRDGNWLAVNKEGFGFFGKTHTEACVRAFVFSKFGPSVDVPKALLDGGNNSE